MALAQTSVSQPTGLMAPGLCVATYTLDQVLARADLAAAQERVDKLSGQKKG